MKKYYLYEMNTTTLNILSIVLLIFLFILSDILGFDNLLSGKDFYFACILLIPYLCLHELLHGFSYYLHGAKLNNIFFGAHLEKGILCCLCKQNVSKKCILISLIYPFVFIGVITYILGIYFNLRILIILSIFNISGCSGDLIMFFSFLGLKDFEYSEYDNPTAFGLYSNKDLSNKKLFSLKYVGCKDELEITNKKRIIVSKTSWIYFIFMMLLSILFFIF